MDIYMDHILTSIMKSRLSQHRKIRFVFHNNGDLQFFFQRTAKACCRERVVRGKDDPIILHNTINAYGNTYDFFFSLFIEFLGFFYNGGQLIEQAVFLMKRVLLYMAVFSFQIRDQSQDLAGRTSIDMASP